MGRATITLAGKGFTKQFVFDVWPMHFPELRLIPGGLSNSHGVPFIQSSKGITTYFRPADVEIEFEIDSFTIEIKDSLQTSTHVNVGSLWDSVSHAMLRNAKDRSFVLIHKVYMRREGKQFKSDAFLQPYIWY